MGESKEGTSEGHPGEGELYTLMVEVVSDDAALASAETDELRRSLAYIEGVRSAEQRRLAGSRALDLGTTVALVLSSNAITAVATGVAVWLQRSRVRIKIGDATVQLEGHPASKAAVGQLIRAITQALRSAQPTTEPPSQSVGAQPARTGARTRKRAPTRG